MDDPTEIVDLKAQVKELQEQVVKLQDALRQEKIFNSAVNKLNDSYWKTVVKYRKRLAEFGVHIKAEEE